MPQNVPEFRFSDDALRLRQFVYEHWCTHGHGPNLRAAHEATGLFRRQYYTSLVFRYLDTFPRPAGVPPWPQLIPEPTARQLEERIAAGGRIVGTPDECARGVQRYADIGANSDWMYVGRPTFDPPPGTRTGTGEALAAPLRALRELGVGHVGVRFRTRSCDELLDQIAAFASEVAPHLND